MKKNEHMTIDKPKAVVADGHIDDFFKKKRREESQEKMMLRAGDVMKASAVNMDDFTDLYTQVSIMQDRATVLEFAKKFMESDRELSEEMKRRVKFAKVLEAIFLEQTEQNDWLGPNAYTIKTSRYDDVVNGVDCVAEFVNDDGTDSRLAMGFDVTYSSMNVQKKIDRILSEIREGKMAKVKYFKSEKTGFRGELSNIPRAVIMLDFDTVEELGALWLDNANKQLSKHWVQITILRQLAKQFEFFADYAGQLNKQEIRRAYVKSLRQIQAILTDKMADQDIEQPSQEKEDWVRAALDRAM